MTDKAKEIEWLRRALVDLYEYAGSVWFDEATATNEEDELMARVRTALRQSAMTDARDEIEQLQAAHVSLRDRNNTLAMEVLSYAEKIGELKLARATLRNALERIATQSHSDPEFAQRTARTALEQAA